MVYAEPMFRPAALILFIYWLVIFCATHLPKSAMPELGSTDKLYHCIGYAGLAFLLCWVVRSKPRLKQIPLVILVGSAYGFLDEVTQKLIPGRIYDVYDLVADGVGILLGIVTYLIARRILVKSDRGKRLIQSLSISLRKPCR